MAVNGTVTVAANDYEILGFDACFFLVAVIPLSPLTLFPHRIARWLALGDERGQARDLAGMDLPRLAARGSLPSDARRMAVARGAERLARVRKLFWASKRNANPDMASTRQGLHEHRLRHHVEGVSGEDPDGSKRRCSRKSFCRSILADGTLDDPRRKDITLGQLLCMTGGYTARRRGDCGGDGAGVSAQGGARANIRDLDASSLRCAMWTNAGAGYSYSSPERHRVHGAATRHGMELQDYIEQRLAKPMGWGAWDFCVHRDGFTMRTPTAPEALPCTRAMPCALVLPAARRQMGDKQLVRRITSRCATRCPRTIRIVPTR